MTLAEECQRLHDLRQRVEKLERESGITPTPSLLDLLEERVKRLEEQREES